VGKSGGLLVSWDPNSFELTPYLTCGGLLLTGLDLQSNRQLSFLNIYGPCSDRKLFWERLEKSGLLAQKNLVLAGDLNLTLSSGEIWGGIHTLGTLASFFINYFHRNKLIDIVPGTLMPTWRNGRAGTEAISKRLDRALISEDLLSSVGVYRAWVEFPYISDHAPIVLQLDSTLTFKAFPFKFNPLWSKENLFVEFVQKIWRDPKFLVENGRQRRLVWKLKELKIINKSLAKGGEVSQKLKTIGVRKGDFI
jgi:hypothetical protein